jgi:hypothetical protein
VRPEIAAALVGAGMLSVLLFPTFAGVLLSRIAQSARQRTNLTQRFNSRPLPHGKDLCKDS